MGGEVFIKAVSIDIFAGDRAGLKLVTTREGQFLDQWIFLIGIYLANGFEVVTPAAVIG